MGSPHYLQGSPWVSNYCIHEYPGVSSLFTGVSVGLQLSYIQVSWGFPIIYRALRGSPTIVCMGLLRSPHYLQGSLWLSNHCLYQVFLGSPHYLQGSPLVSDYCIYGSPRVSSLFTRVSMGLQQWYIWVSWGFPIIYRGLRGSPIIVYMGLHGFPHYLQGVSYLGLQGSPHYLQVSPWVVHMGLQGSPHY